MRHALLTALALAGVLATPARAQVSAFVDVAVIPMDRERVLEHQTVIVRDGKVASRVRRAAPAFRPGQPASTDAAST